MSKLLVLRGVPGSGKSTYAQTLQGQEDTVVVNRDSIRFILFGKYWGVDESIVTAAELAMVDSGLQADKTVVLDATNLAAKFLLTKLSIAAKYGATVEFRDFPIALSEAVKRDAGRERTVGFDVIEGFFRRGRIDPLTGELPPIPEPLVFDPVVWNSNLQAAYIVDTDGTVANHEPHRSPYDTSLYAQDTVIEHVASTVRALHADGYTILALSGRDSEFRDVTERWWRDNNIPFDFFYMRGKGDKRMDAVVKYELFKEHIAPNFNVLGAFDDRPQVIRMWHAIGVPVLDVGEGREF